MADLIERDAVAYKVKSCITIPADSEWDSGYNTAMAEAKQYIQNAPAVNRWIPCSERLPEHTGYYLVSAEFDNIRGRQDVSKFVIGRHGGHWYGTIRGEYITHWMLLPEPPEKE